MHIAKQKHAMFRQTDPVFIISICTGQFSLFLEADSFIAEETQLGLYETKGTGTNLPN